VDAGPLIGLIQRRDSHHRESVRGFQQVEQAGTTLVVPAPIVLEVYKWLLHHADVQTARQALPLMQARLDIVHIGSGDFMSALELLLARADWLGTIEDAIVAQSALRLGVPIWTFNYRDLQAFPSLHFWNPA
jgi:predicted nucleic acid-binding protein